MVRAIPVPRFLAVTVALATVAPLGSLTVPTMSAVVTGTSGQLRKKTRAMVMQETTTYTRSRLGISLAFRIDVPPPNFPFTGIPDLYRERWNESQSQRWRFGTVVHICLPGATPAPRNSGR